MWLWLCGTAFFSHRCQTQHSSPDASSPPPPPPGFVCQLTEMGFAEVRAKKALMFGNGNDLENAVNWIMEHQEDAGIDDPIPEGDQPAAAAPMDVDNGSSAAGKPVLVSCDTGSVRGKRICLDGLSCGVSV